MVLSLSLCAMSCPGTAPWGWQSHHCPILITGSGIKRRLITSSGSCTPQQPRKWDFSSFLATTCSQSPCR